MPTNVVTYHAIQSIFKQEHMRHPPFRGYTYQVITNMLAIQSKVEAQNQDQQDIYKGIRHDKGNIQNVVCQGRCKSSGLPSNLIERVINT